jgi:hypothetical protein
VSSELPRAPCDSITRSRAFDDLAGARVGRRLGWSTRPQLCAVAQVELALLRPEEAVALLERALAADGPYEALVRAQLEELRGSDPSGPPQRSPSDFRNWKKSSPRERTRSFA